MFLTKSRSSVFVLPLLALFSPACSSSNDGKSGSTTAADTSGAEDMNETESNVEALGVSFVGSDGQSVATASLVASAAGAPGFFLQPAGCVKVTADTSTHQATYVFTNCTGPLGLAHLDGTIAVGWTLQVSPVTLTLNYATQNFKINGATITSWMATAVITEPLTDAVDAGLAALDGAAAVDAGVATSLDAGVSARAMHWTATLSGTTAGGRAFQRTTTKDLKWTVGQPCLSLSGTSQGTISGANITTTITSFDRCASACPQAGSEISVVNTDNGDSIDITYDGGPAALLTVNGKSSTIALLCAN